VVVGVVRGPDEVCADEVKLMEATSAWRADGEGRPWGGTLGGG
jgi:hypothetical protein